jgi:hypothetical protein
MPAIFSSLVRPPLAAVGGEILRRDAHGRRVADREATRLIEQYRTSPTANTPGTEVSSGRGARSTGHRDG